MRRVHHELRRQRAGTHQVHQQEGAAGAFAFPTYTNSIKDIAKWLGFKWRHDNVGAMSAIELYLKYAEDLEAGRDGMQLVLDYNEDDCIATRVVKDWLVSQKVV